MTSQDQIQAKIDKIASLPDELRAVLTGLAPDQLDMPCAKGEWTVRQVVHHLADAHLNGFGRMKLVLTEKKPILKPYEQDDWVKLPDMDAPVEPSLAILDGLHDRWQRLLAVQPAASWTREGIHLDSGRVTLLDLLHVYVDHGNQHLEQIRRLRRTLGLPD